MESDSTFDYLPDNLVMTILAKLPAKALVQSSLVSREWYFLIGKNELVRYQVEFYLSQSNENFVLVIPNYLPHRNSAVLLSAETGMQRQTLIGARGVSRPPLNFYA